MDSDTKVKEYIKKGEECLKEKDFKNAIKHYEQAHQLVPDNTDIVQKLNELYFQVGDLKKSKEFFLRLIKLNPDFSESEDRADLQE